MLYAHHGNTTFDHYDKYFVKDVDWDVLIYLQLANKLIHETNPRHLSIAEDMSGMPGICRTPEEGGIGFDFRLGMGIPDYWIKIVKEQSDEQWNIHEIWSMLSNRRFKEKTIAYSESHDQALVGDKTLAFWLMDKEMYFHMHIDDQNIIIDRGIALHKIFRLITMSMGGEGYLNFMGNEFGHPEWIDFPRLGNNWSYKYARRQWSLADNQELKYKYLLEFDKAMLFTVGNNNVLKSLPGKELNMDVDNKVIVAERNNMIFVFNFHPNNSIFGYKFWVPFPGKYKIILNTDNSKFGGFDRVDENYIYETDSDNFLSIYLTNRTGLILQKMDEL
jgi:1,4-alpha-glucan branching enzyme